MFALINKIIKSSLRILLTVCFSQQKMDKNRDGVVTLDEFIFSCQEVFFPL